MEHIWGSGQCGFLLVGDTHSIETTLAAEQRYSADPVEGEMLAWLWVGLMGCGTSADDVVALESALGTSFEVVLEQADGLSTPRGLGFHPDVPDQLWVVNAGTSGATIVENALSDDRTAQTKIDIASGHFMINVSSIAWGDMTRAFIRDVDEQVRAFATCQEDNNRSWDSNSLGFMGPTLWPGELGWFAEYPLIVENNELLQLGSHLDMLHSSPFCMGIAHNDGNSYWVFDGKNKSLVYYDFQDPHYVGGDDHSDGIIRFYDEIQLTRVPSVPSHLELDKQTGELFIADTGTGRILKVDTWSGEIAETLPAIIEPLAEYSAVRGVTWEVFAQGLDQPSGIVLTEDRVYVSDYQSGDVIAFSREGEELERQTVPEGEGLMGITIGPEGALWYVHGRSHVLGRAVGR